MEAEHELLVQHFVEGVDHETDLPIVGLASQYLEMLPPNELDILAPFGRHLVVATVVFSLHGKAEIVEFGAVLRLQDARPCPRRRGVPV